MRRADRLFTLVQRIRSRRLSTAAQLAQALEVSLRTVYRDIADLQASGVPIEGEAGVGYRMGAGYTLPPLMFSAAEAQALVAAVRMAQPRMDAAMAADAETALGRILAVLPPDAGLPDAQRQCLQQLREAVLARRRLRLHYADGQGRASERVVWPLGCFFWGQVWTLAAWCEWRQDFRSFRIDRIIDAQPLPGVFVTMPGRTLADLLRAVRRRPADNA
jgi:predicted DNA-binding transcriptional regulator YafY